MPLRLPWCTDRRGLEQLKPLDRDERVNRHYRLDAVRGHLYEMLGDFAKAVQHYRTAASKTASLPEQNYLGDPGSST